MKNIPVLHVSGTSLAESYELALINLYKNGVKFKTQYDKVDSPPSIDATMNITILDPLSEPMIHKAFPGGIEDLYEYVMEVQGNKDHWVKNINDPKDTRWEYTYHGRLANYGAWREIQGGKSIQTGTHSINQIENVIDKLSKQPFTRQAQMITWMPCLDIECYDPPCLQSLWYRLVQDDTKENTWWLNCNVRFRSNDAWGASFMNMFGFIMFNKEIIADGIRKRTGKVVNIGRLNWHADSYHIYGKDISDAKQRLFDRLSTTDFSDRVYNFDDEMIQDIYNDARETVCTKIEEYDRTH